MYIENDNSGIKIMNSSDQDVNEATAALKGMLGIGGQIAEASTTETTETKQEEEPKKSKKKKKQKKKKEGGKQKQNRGAPKRQDSDTSENFAWSAFQASPDASTLPIPAFSPPAESKRTMNEEAVSVLTQAPSITPETTKNSEERVDDTSNKTADDEEANPKVVIEKESGDTNSSVSHEAETKTETEQSPAEEETPVSSTGINLAALASPPSSTAPTPSPSHPPPNQVPSFPTNIYQQPPPPPPMYSNTSPPQQQQFVTIQVQVPPVLLPGRQMVVASPMGYPVQVRVPEGVPPGMIIPVHVPVAPPPHQQQQPYNSPSYPYGHPLHRR